MSHVGFAECGLCKGSVQCVKACICVHSLLHLHANVCRKPVDEYVNAIRKLKVSDVTGAVSNLLKTPPSLAAIGDIANVPRYAEIERRFKK